MVDRFWYVFTPTVCNPEATNRNPVLVPARRLRTLVRGCSPLLWRSELGLTHLHLNRNYKTYCDLSVALLRRDYRWNKMFPLPGSGSPHRYEDCGACRKSIRLGQIKRCSRCRIQFYCVSIVISFPLLPSLSVHVGKYHSSTKPILFFFGDA